jgi:hypothetical protein
MHDLIGAVVESVSKVDRIVSAWQIVIDGSLARDLLIEAVQVAVTGDCHVHSTQERRLQHQGILVCSLPTYTITKD